METASCITVVENFTGTEAIIGKMDELRLLSQKQRSDLYDVLEAFYCSWDMPPRQPGTMRLLLEGLGNSRFPSLFPPWVGDDVSTEVSELAQQIGCFLLYSHTVAIPDPLSRLFTIRPEYRKQHLSSFVKDYGFGKFVAWFTMILSLKELIDRGVIHLFPESLCNERNSAASGTLCRHDMQDAGLMAIAAKMPGGLEHEIEGVPIPILGANFMLLQCQDTDATVVAPNNAYYAFWQRKAELMRVDMEAALKVESANVHALRNLSVPVFDILNHRDLLAIRENEEVFCRWRADLGAYLSSLENSPFGEVPNAAEQQRKAEELFRSKYHDLQDRLKAGSALSSLRSGTAKFGIRSLAVYVLTGNLAAALTAATAAEVTNVLYDFLFKGVSNEQKALLRHYALMLEKAE